MGDGWMKEGGSVQVQSGRPGPSAAEQNRFDGADAEADVSASERIIWTTNFVRSVAHSLIMEVECKNSIQCIQSITSCISGHDSIDESEKAYGRSRVGTSLEPLASFRPATWTLLENLSRRHRARITIRMIR
jgi:hypothetical protein